MAPEILRRTLEAIGRPSSELRVLDLEGTRTADQSLEHLVGIPGTIGGAVMGNASSDGRDIGSVVDSVTVLERDGENLQAHALRVGARLLVGLRTFVDRYPIVGNVRGSGLFLGVELVRDRETLEPAGAEASFVANRMRDHGILLGTDLIVDRQGKLDFLASLHALSVPTVYREPKGLFVLEALACGVPVVQPAHGAFPEMIERTGGGILVEPHAHRERVVRQRRQQAAQAVALAKMLVDDEFVGQAEAGRHRDHVRARRAALPAAGNHVLGHECRTCRRAGLVHRSRIA